MQYFDTKQIELKGSYDAVNGAITTLIEEIKAILVKLNIHSNKDFLAELERIKTKMELFPHYLERKEELYELMKKLKMVD